MLGFVLILVSPIFLDSRHLTSWIVPLAGSLVLFLSIPFSGTVAVFSWRTNRPRMLLAAGGCLIAVLLSALFLIASAALRKKQIMLDLCS